MKTHLIAVGSRQKVNPQDIMFLIADINYTTIIFQDGNKMLVSTTLGTLEKRLLETKHFYRTHRSFLVNLLQVERLETNQILMKNNQLVLISRRKKDSLKEMLLS